MNTLNRIKQFLIEEDGPTAVEYAVMLALIIGAIIGSIGQFGGANGVLWSDNVNSIEQSFSGS